MSSPPNEHHVQDTERDPLPAPWPQKPRHSSEPVGSLQMWRGGETVEGPEGGC